MHYGNEDFVPVILGTGLGAYATARALHEAFGVRSLAIGRAALRETMHSSIVDVRVHRGLDDPDTVVAVLRDLAAELPGRTRVIFATIEYYTNVVIDHRAELEADYEIPLVGEAIKRRVIDKTDFYRTCADWAYPIRRPSSSLGLGRRPDARRRPPVRLPRHPQALRHRHLPSPAVRGQGEGLPDPRRPRAACGGQTDRGAGYTGDLIVQELLAGDESVMRVANTYSDRTGRCGSRLSGRWHSPSGTRS